MPAKEFDDITNWDYLLEILYNATTQFRAKKKKKKQDTEVHTTEIISLNDTRSFITEANKAKENKTSN